MLLLLAIFTVFPEFFVIADGHFQDLKDFQDAAQQKTQGNSPALR